MRDDQVSMWHFRESGEAVDAVLDALELAAPRMMGKQGACKTGVSCLGCGKISCLLFGYAVQRVVVGRKFGLDSHLCKKYSRIIQFAHILWRKSLH